MTYTVSSGTLNSTMPYHTTRCQRYPVARFDKAHIAHVIGCSDSGDGWSSNGRRSGVDDWLVVTNISVPVAVVFRRRQWLKWGGAQSPAPIWAPCNSMSPLIESIKCYLCPNNAKLVGLEWYGVCSNLASSGEPPASQNHFNHWASPGKPRCEHPDCGWLPAEAAAGSTYAPLSYLSMHDLMRSSFWMLRCFFGFRISIPPWIPSASAIAVNCHTSLHTDIRQLLNCWWYLMPST